MTESHTMRIFDEDLHAISNEVIILFNHVRAEVDNAIKALITQDTELARSVIASDKDANLQMSKVNLHTVKALARQQAMAGDLRAIVAASRIAPHLERIGDYAKGTAKRTLKLSQPLTNEIEAELTWMAQRLDAMLLSIMEAYQTQNADMANIAWGDDDKLDTLYESLFSHILQLMLQDNHWIVDGTQLMLIAKGLERAGDHAADIAEEIYFMVKGIPLPRP
ncbi:phosphate signaling complex protein PhoU [Shewanella sp. SG44-6]|uniref:phosphate signaling complex protein PhoU n=1 Tax=Shewanella sp. SG44-6 TaxID=2760959 RepID=UPI0016038325|nr:phosphate signaling complex protein PhoU [Shewanella sp. SG44-6]MBB1391838.1 phosphate signaling complex protein PhoU [Shewanella sp. SG44-6]